MELEQAGFEILVAEDNAADVTLVREALKEHQVNCALHVMKDGAQAMAFLNALDHDPNAPRLDLVLLDMHLPRHDGEEILRRLRSTEHYSQTPVIVMTASASPGDELKAEQNAVLHYFRKPTSLAEFMQLGAIVRSILGHAAGENLRRTRGGTA